MRKASLLIVGLVCLSVIVHAGEVITNDTGEDARGLRVTFSSPVLITDFGDILTSVDPLMMAYEFGFSGGVVEPWGSHWMSWAPATAEILSHEWLIGDLGIQQGSIAGDISEQPVVTGDLLNPDYFAHPAYVMQGVAERDTVFAMPLAGIDDLEFLPIVDGVDPETVDWSLDISEPEGIGASIEDGILYIWGKDATWAGYGEVILQATIGEAASFVMIPVTVFREDKTLTNSAGEKDYFVPWTPELDANRILSVEQHMRTYDKDEGFLDRSIQWSRWKKMEYIEGAQVLGWTAIDAASGWTEKAQYLQVDNTLVELRNIGCNGIIYWRMYALESMDSPFPVEVFDGSHPALAITDDNLRYLINEAHRQGFQIIITPHIAEPMGVYRDHLTPPSFPIWFDHYGQIVKSNASICQATGAEGVVVGNILYLPSPIHWGLLTNAQWNNTMVNILNDDVRDVYPGPAIYMPGSLENGDFRDILPLLREVDIVGGNSNFLDYPVDDNPTVSQVERYITDKIRQLVGPMNAALNKPILMNEGGVISQEDGIRLADLMGIAAGNARYDGEEQRIWYEAYLNSERQFDYIYGFGWFYWPLAPGAGGFGEVSYSPKLKPAEDEIRAAYLPGSSPPIIQMDGKSADWTEEMRIYDDSKGDSVSIDADLISLSGVKDNDYYYLHIETVGPLTELQALQVLIDLDGDKRADMPLSVFSDEGQWAATLGEEGMNWSTLRGRPDVVANTSNSEFEIRIPCSLVNFVPAINVYVTIFDIGRQRNIDAIPFSLIE